jgi:hypothetical protein
MNLLSIEEEGEEEDRFYSLIFINTTITKTLTKNKENRK